MEVEVEKTVDITGQLSPGSAVAIFGDIHSLDQCIYKGDCLEGKFRANEIHTLTGLNPEVVVTFHSMGGLERHDLSQKNIASIDF